MHLQGVLALLAKLQKAARSSEDKMCIKKRQFARVRSVEEEDERVISNLCLLGMPELVLEEILRKLDPRSLCRTAVTCKQLWELGTGDHLWEPLLQAKWGKVIGPAARELWLLGSSSPHAIGANSLIDNMVRKSLIWPFLRVWPSLASGSKALDKVDRAVSRHSVMACYTDLEAGVFSFPAQVYNREHGHVGFLLSCYDAELVYDRKTDTFRAKYPPHGSRTVVTEEGVQWSRLRSPPIQAQAHELHESACLDLLHPGDHVEVQWRRHKDFPYGWWYGIVGHLDACSQNPLSCGCHLDGTVWLEFNQYAVGSRWRRAAVNRKTHREAGNETEGFYAGIRKLQLKGEISVWKQLWPTQTLD